MVKLRQLDKNILEREEAKEVVKVQAAIVASLSYFERHQVTEWGKDVEISSDTKLQHFCKDLQRPERCPQILIPPLFVC